MGWLAHERRCRWCWWAWPKHAPDAGTAQGRLGTSCKTSTDNLDIFRTTSGHLHGPDRVKSCKKPLSKLSAAALVCWRSRTAKTSWTTPVSRRARPAPPAPPPRQHSYPCLRNSAAGLPCKTSLAARSSPASEPPRGRGTCATPALRPRVPLYGPVLRRRQLDGGVAASRVQSGARCLGDASPGRCPRSAGPLTNSLVPQRWA